MEEDLIVDEMEYIPTPLDIAKKKGLKRLETNKDCTPCSDKVAKPQTDA